jgi:hypothetical protein
MLDALTAELFEPLVGSEFSLIDGPGALLLAEVTRFKPQPGAPRLEPFSLLFTGDPASVLPQRIHGLEHPTLGRLDIFLVPIGPAPSGEMRYEAVFN